MNIIKRIITATIFPKSCLICNKIISESYLCSDEKIHKKIKFLNNPACSICFQPLDIKINDQEICLSCAKNRPDYFKALSVMSYDQSSRPLITKLKYHDQTNLAKYLSEAMLQLAQPIIADIDFIAPIPMHKWRLIGRRYNQAALLARHFAKISNIKATMDLIIRTKNNNAQTGLSKKLRQKNISNVFEFNKKYTNLVIKKNILLIDDVMTTGATVNACSKILNQAGVSRVYVITAAKTVIN